MFQIFLRCLDLQIKKAKVNYVYYQDQGPGGPFSLNFISLESKELSVRQSLSYMWSGWEGDYRGKKQDNEEIYEENRNLKHIHENVDFLKKFCEAFTGSKSPS